MKVLACMLCFCLLVACARAEQPFAVELEAGALWAGRAEVRIPGDEGTRFSFRGDLDADTTPYARGRLLWQSGERHTWLLTIVPIEIEASGRLRRETRFAGTVFPAQQPVKALYRFNNYRLTYRYRFRQTERWSAEAGGTLFVRDAKIALKTAGASAEDADVGLVPLLHFRVAYRLPPALELVLEGDALAAPQGRAFDVLCGLEYRWGERLQLGAGYRVLEGGADNDSVYTFALFHHAAATLRWRF